MIFYCHCEERSDEAIRHHLFYNLMHETEVARKLKCGLLRLRLAMTAAKERG